MCNSLSSSCTWDKLFEIWRLIFHINNPTKHKLQSCIHCTCGCKIFMMLTILWNNFVSQTSAVLSGMQLFINYWISVFHLTLILTVVIRWSPETSLNSLYQATSQMRDFKMRRRRRRRNGWTLLMLLAPASIVPRTQDQDTNTTSYLVSSSGESNINTVNYSAILPPHCQAT